MVTNKQDLSDKIHQISLLQQAFIANRLKQLQLNTQQARTLSFVFVYPGTIQKKLAQYLSKQDATVTNLLKGLEKKQYLYREIPRDNERQKKIYLTKQGEEIAKQVQLIFADLNKEFLANISNEEKIEAEKVLEKIIQGFRP
ncbi:MarR family winged helix-turn-helix transcriptional regulator [Listeria sp. PSOL-1]|uniref:MarR family winged helix-turn-helix transcriptional regulator n=1 Tax=Listeria sp. PSOL-1 TaxID=1844999 RepID=UPI0013D27BAC|nr:MarR family transcriptional regulator [Listeria sp. PSOL-1]